MWSKTARKADLRLISLVTNTFSREIGIHLYCYSVVNDAIPWIVLYPFQVHRIWLIVMLTETSFDPVFEFSHHLLSAAIFDFVVLHLSNYGLDIPLKSQVQKNGSTKST